MALACRAQRVSSTHGADGRSVMAGSPSPALPPAAGRDGSVAAPCRWPQLAPDRGTEGSCPSTEMGTSAWNPTARPNAHSLWRATGATGPLPPHSRQKLAFLSNSQEAKFPSYRNRCSRKSRVRGAPAGDTVVTWGLRSSPGPPGARTQGLHGGTKGNPSRGGRRGQEQQEGRWAGDTGQ